jgi:hypothetical protein
MVLVIKDIIKGDTAVSTDDGDVVYKEIVAILELGKPVELDFSGINIMTTAFLNAAIGQLYSAFNSEQLNSLLKLVNVAADDRILFKKVIERAKEYFQNKKGFEDSANKAIYGS